MKAILTTLPLLLFVSGTAFAACPPQDQLPDNTVCIAWQAPTENVDGSPIPASGPGSIASYAAQFGNASRNYTETLFIADETARDFTTPVGSITITRPPAGGDVDVFIAMTATNTEGETSAFSNEVVRTLTFPVPVPGAPTLQEAIINIVIQ